MKLVREKVSNYIPKCKYIKASKGLSLCPQKFKRKN